MYKLFLCLRYLRSKVLAWFAVLAVMLCVAMMLIVTSVMNGFLNKIETAAKGLFGDIIVSDESGAGLGRYDEFVAVAAGGDYPLRWTDVPAAEADGQVVFAAPAAELDAWALRQAAEGGEAPSFPGSAELVRSGTATGRVPGRFTLAGDGQVTFRPGEAIEGDSATLAIRRARVTLPAAVPDVEAGTPFIWAWGVLRLAPSLWDPYGGRYQQGVQVAGIRLPERARVTDFEEGLFVQTGEVTCAFTPPVAQTREALRAEQARLRGLIERERADVAAGETTSRQTLKRLEMSLTELRLALAELDRVAAARQRVIKLEREIERLRRLGAGYERLQPKVEQLQEVRREAATEDYSIILGLGLQGLSFRTDRGEVFRWAYPGCRVVLDVFPLGRPSADVLAKQPEQRMLVVADDNRSGVASIDAHIVYLPFATLQRMNHMEPVRAAGDPRRVISPGRATQIHLKVAAGVDGEPALLRVCDRLRALYERFAAHDPVGAVQAGYRRAQGGRRLQRGGRGHLPGLRCGHRPGRLGPGHDPRLGLRAEHQPDPRLGRADDGAGHLEPRDVHVRYDSQRGARRPGAADRRRGDRRRPARRATAGGAGGPHAAGGGAAL